MYTITSIKVKMKRLTAAVASAMAAVASTLRFQFQSKPALGPALTPNINALLLNLCEGDRDRALWVLRWLAYPLRNEGAKMATALLVNGVEGSGKTLFFGHIIMPMYGNRAAAPRDSLDGTFNAWMARKLFVLAEDFRADTAAVGHLKYLLTSDRIKINAKGAESKIERNKMNFVFVSSDRQALNDDACDRRFMVLEPQKSLPPAAYTAVAGEIANGGIEAFHQFLIHVLDMHGFNTHAVPLNKPSISKVAA